MHIKNFATYIENIYMLPKKKKRVTKKTIHKYNVILDRQSKIENKA